MSGTKYIILLTPHREIVCQFANPVTKTKPNPNNKTRRHLFTTSKSQHHHQCRISELHYMRDYTGH